MLLLAASLLLLVGRPRRPRFQAQRIVRISRVVSDLNRAERFYQDAIGFKTISRGPADPPFGMGPADQVTMQLGLTSIALVRFAEIGRAYPLESHSDDVWFQHMAIVVSDMDAAYAHLCQTTGWHPISEGGPQLLPPENGSVRAFKFRDPDGHPLELIWFPNSTHDAADPLFRYIDHSALAISATPNSLKFYRNLGFRISAHSMNRGHAQDRLDGIRGADVRVTGLRPALGTGPGLELLGYRPAGRTIGSTLPNDVATDWVTIQVASLNGATRQTMRDPDGHLLLLVDQGSGEPD